MKNLFLLWLNLTACSSPCPVWLFCLYSSLFCFTAWQPREPETAPAAEIKDAQGPHWPQQIKYSRLKFIILDCQPLFTSRDSPGWLFCLYSSLFCFTVRSASLPVLLYCLMAQSPFICPCSIWYRLAPHACSILKYSVYHQGSLALCVSLNCCDGLQSPTGLGVFIV